jgi:hypothetical protein
MDTGFNKFWINIRRIANTVYLLIAFTVFIARDGIAETSGFIPRQMTSETVNLDDSQTSAIQIIQLFNKSGRQVIRGNIEFSSFVSTDSQSIPGQQAKQESNKAKGYSEIIYKLLEKHRAILFMSFTFIVGGGFLTRV